MTLAAEQQNSVPNSIAATAATVVIPPVTKYKPEMKEGQNTVNHSPTRYKTTRQRKGGGLEKERTKKKKGAAAQRQSGPMASRANWLDRSYLVLAKRGQGAYPWQIWRDGCFLGGVRDKIREGWGHK